MGTAQALWLWAIGLTSFLWLIDGANAKPHLKDVKITLPWGTYHASSYDKNGDVCIQEPNMSAPRSDEVYLVLHILGHQIRTSTHRTITVPGS